MVVFSILACIGCIFPVSGYNEGMKAIHRAEFFAELTLEFGSSPPDMVIHASSAQIQYVLRNFGADAAFPYKKSYEYDIRKIYQEEGIVNAEDIILLYNDGIDRWMNIIVVKEDDGKTLLWVRKPVCCGFIPEPGSPYYMDWIDLVRNECAMRGIRFTTPNTNSL